MLAAKHNGEFSTPARGAKAALADILSEQGKWDEAEKLLKEVQRLQALADQAEASRMESLNHLVVTEFRQLNRRLDALVPVAETPLLKLP